MLIATPNEMLFGHLYIYKHVQMVFQVMAGSRKALMKMAERKLLTVDQLAEILNVPKSWIYERTRQGQEAIPHMKLGMYIRFNLDDVIEFFKNKKGAV